VNAPLEDWELEDLRMQWTVWRDMCSLLMVGAVFLEIGLGVLSFFIDVEALLITMIPIFGALAAGYFFCDWKLQRLDQA
jgi:hypothetical protein